MRGFRDVKPLVDVREKFPYPQQNHLPDDSGNKAYKAELPDDSGDALPEFLKIREEVDDLPDKIGPEDFSHRKEAK